MCLDGSCRCLSTHGMRGEVVLSVLGGGVGGGGVGGMNTPAGVIPLPRVAMNGKLQLQVQLLWFLMGNQTVNICSLLSYSPLFFVKTPHFSSHV